MISAIVLAAGLSRRMGQPKLILPWNNSTVIRQVVNTLIQADLDEILIVTGGAHEAVEAALSDLPIRFVHNSLYAQSEMLYSIQLGLSTLSDQTDAALIVLGDQPQIQTQVVRAVIAEYRENKHELVVPSFEMHRGHPLLVGRGYWPMIINLFDLDTLRTFLDRNQHHIYYIEVTTPSILQDLDTPTDYQQSHGK